MNSVIQEIIANYFWFLIAIGFGIGETFTATFYLLPFALGGLVAGLASLLGMSLQVQSVVFLVFSAVGIYVVTKYAKPKDEDNDSTVGSFRYVGDEFILDDSVSQYTSTDIKFKGDIWKAVSSTGDIDSGTLVKVVDIDGAKLVVEKVD